MSLNTAAVDLTNALESVDEAWQDAQEVWKDAVSQDFGENTIDPLTNRVRGVLQAIDRLAPILARAVRECS
jgi:hypothetical protein